MREESYGAPNLDPAFLSDTVTSNEFEVALFNLLTHEISTMTFDGHRIVSVNGREHSEHDDTVIAVCRDEEGHRHVFTYTLDPDSRVAHEVIKDEPDSRRA